MTQDSGRLLEAMWGRESLTRPGPKPTLTIGRLADAGVAAADADGLAAVSMARVAADLGFTTMSLYRYVSSKRDLLALMVDRACDRPEVDDTTAGSWRDRLERWARALRDRLDAHRWVLDVPITGPPDTPNLVAWMEAGLQCFRGIDLSYQQQLSAMLLVDGYVRGHLRLVASVEGASVEGASVEGAAGEAAGASGEGSGGPDYVERLLALADPAEFPAVHAALGSGALEDDEDDFGLEEFEFGLRTLLDGVAVLVDRKTD